MSTKKAPKKKVAAKKPAPKKTPAKNPVAKKPAVAKKPLKTKPEVVKPKPVAPKVPSAATVKSTKGGVRPRHGNGSLKAAILDICEVSDPKVGAPIAEIAKENDCRYEAIAVWFSTTGKKIPGLNKVAPGHYHYTPGPKKTEPAKSS